MILLMLLWGPSSQRRLLEACPPISAGDCNQLRQAAEQTQRNLQRLRKEWPKYLPMVVLWVISTLNGSH